MSITSSVNKLNVSTNAKEALLHQYNFNYSSRKPQLSTDPDKFLEYYIEAKNVLSEFGYDNEEAIAKKVCNLVTKDLRKKCLIFENFHILNSIIDTNVSLFQISPEIIYAKIRCYNELALQNSDKIKDKSLPVFVHDRGKKFEEKYGFTEKFVLEEYPLTKQKLQLMERIHNAKKNAQSKSGGVSL